MNKFCFTGRRKASEHGQLLDKTRMALRPFLVD